MQDDIYDPFEPVTDDVTFLRALNAGSYSENAEIEQPQYSHYIYIDVEVEES